MKKPAVSVIVPVYQVKEYLPACLDSLLGQTFRDFECILVDDGSTDGSGEICDRYAAGDSRFKVIHRKNGGLSAARNSGLDIAVGAHISLVDSDDLLHPRFLETLYRTALDSGADIAACGYLRFSEESALPASRLTGKFRLLDRLGAFQALADLSDDEACVFMTVAWNKLYRRELFEALRYPEGKLHEDEYLIHSLLLRTERFCQCEDVLYFYRIRENSITGNQRAVDLRHLDALDAFAERCRLLKAPQYRTIYPSVVTKYFNIMLYLARDVAIPSGQLRRVYFRYLFAYLRYFPWLKGKRRYLRFLLHPFSIE